MVLLSANLSLCIFKLLLTNVDILTFNPENTDTATVASFLESVSQNAADNNNLVGLCIY